MPKKHACNYQMTQHFQEKRKHTSRYKHPCTLIYSSVVGNSQPNVHYWILKKPVVSSYKVTIFTDE